MKPEKLFRILVVALLLAVGALAAAAKTPVRKVLFIGDSMTGWMAERLGAYGDKNGFTVDTYTWDGSTMKKWATSPGLQRVIRESDPDAVFISLGLNEMFQTNPAGAFSGYLQTIKNAVGDAELLWIGPPSWPGKNIGEQYNRWMHEKLGNSFFRSFDLKLPRQSKSNPHPTREGIIEWMDEVIEWIPGHTDMKFPGLVKPGPSDKQMSRGKKFIYKRMKEQL